ncbi:MAG TPA: argininosuccinate lyase [Elusimicrobiota bacterium]|nr:argininosuccinate lyase [Elusimicrobiota bacterium]
MKKNNRQTTATVRPEDFVASIGFDHRLAVYDLTASLAHVEMLGRQRIISGRDRGRLVRGLAALLGRVKRGVRLPAAEDIHYAIEKALFKAAGPAAGRMHTARSRNDQTVTAFRLYVRDQIDVLSGSLEDLSAAFVQLAEKNRRAVMPGYTHLQPGQPILAAHHFLAYAWMFQRDRERLADVRRRTNVLPLGAAALAGTTFPIDREWVARRLGFSGVIENSIDAVSDRDFLAEFLAALSLVMAHLSRFCEELMIWSNPCFAFVTVADPFVTGSSIMPQKRNPDMAELVRGKTGRVYGSLTAVLTLLKAQPLAYNRDLQEDKPPVFDAVDAVKASLDVTAPMVRSLRINADKMRAACRLGYILATDLADALVRRGMPFRQAHGVVAAAVNYAQERDLPLEDIPLPVLRKFSPLFGTWVHEVLSVDGAVAARKSRGGTAPAEVSRQIQRLRRLLRKK